MVKNSDKERSVYSGYGMVAFERTFVSPEKMFSINFIKVKQLFVC